MNSCMKILMLTQKYTFQEEQRLHLTTMLVIIMLGGEESTNGN